MATWGNPCFSFLNLVFVIFQAPFQNKMTGCVSEVGEYDLSLYTLPGLPLEKPRTYWNGPETTPLLLYTGLTEFIEGMGEAI